jgi:hypothetical protein
MILNRMKNELEGNVSQNLITKVVLLYQSSITVNVITKSELKSCGLQVVH